MLWKYTPQAKRILGRVDYTQAKLNTNSSDEVLKERHLSSGGGGCYLKKKKKISYVTHSIVICPCFGMSVTFFSWWLIVFHGFTTMYVRCVEKL